MQQDGQKAARLAQSSLDRVRRVVWPGRGARPCQAAASGVEIYAAPAYRSFETQKQDGGGSERELETFLRAAARKQRNKAVAYVTEYDASYRVDDVGEHLMWVSAARLPRSRVCAFVAAAPCSQLWCDAHTEVCQHSVQSILALRVGQDVL